MRILLVLISLLLFAGCGTDSAVDDSHPVTVSLLRDPAPTEAGVSFTVAWRFHIADGWHLYWDGLNDSGAPPTVALDLPEGWSAGPLRWPVPERHVAAGGILDHVYFDELVLLQDLHTPTNKDGTFTAKIEWLVCRDLCAVGDTVLASTDMIEDAEAMDAARARAPIAMPRGHYTAAWRGAVLDVGLPRVDRLEFMPASDCGPLADLVRDGAADGSELSLECRVVDGVAGPVRGLVHGVFGENRITFEIDMPATTVAGTPPEENDE